MQVITVRAEFHCSPLWMDVDPWNLDPREDLGLPDDLADEWDRWAKDYDATLDQDYPPWSGFPDVASADEWLRRGERLTARTAGALPAQQYEMIYAFAGHLPERYLATREGGLGQPRD
jgi:hypothetical protein